MPGTRRPYVFNRIETIPKAEILHIKDRKKGRLSESLAKSSDLPGPQKRGEGRSIIEERLEKKAKGEIWAVGARGGRKVPKEAPTGRACGPSS